MNRLSLIAAMTLIAALAGCDKPPSEPSGTGTAKPSPERPDATPASAESKTTGPGHGGEVIELGTISIGDLTVRASRDKGELKAGGDVPVDVWLTTTDGKPASATAVRFWIGTEDAKGSLKARGEVEDPAKPNHWHNHVEAPNPLPDGAKLWVEVEASLGKTAGSFDLKP